MKTLLFAILLACITGLSAVAQDRPNKVFGEVNIQSTQAEKVSSYDLQAAEAERFLKDLSEGKSGSITINDGGIFYLTGLYLYCGQKNGVCPFILDSLLAADFLNGKGQTNTCPITKKFWDHWIKNGFEERLPYLVSIGGNETLREFNKTKRSYYIQCEETLKNFQIDATVKRSISLSAKLAEQIRIKEIHVFEATQSIETMEKKGQ